MELKLQVNRVTVVQHSLGPDMIHIVCDGPTPFPELDKDQPGAYSPGFKIETRRGYAREWLQTMGFDLEAVKFVEYS